MKNIIYPIVYFVFSLSFFSCGKDENIPPKKPSNFIVILDLSDRILVSQQLDKDIYLIEKYFNAFEKRVRQNLILTSKDRFTVKILPQKNSTLNIEYYEDLLQIYLDEKDVKDKNKSLLALSNSLSKTLQSLKKDAQFSSLSKDYFGVDIWAYLHDNGKTLSKSKFENKILILTDGYFDFENQEHVIKAKNQYTSTRFLNELNTTDWKEVSQSKEYGLLPIQLDKNTKWIIAGIAGKIPNDILQTEKIRYFWEKWLKQSGVASSNFILNGSKTDMNSNLQKFLE